MRSSALLVRLLCVAALARAQKRETWPHPGAYDLHKRVSSTNECDPNYQAGPSLWEWLLSRHRHGHGLKLVDKWTTYLPAYEAYLSKFRGCDVNILELGVSQVAPRRCGSTTSDRARTRTAPTCAKPSETCLFDRFSLYAS